MLRRIPCISKTRNIITPTTLSRFTVSSSPSISLTSNFRFCASSSTTSTTVDSNATSSGGEFGDNFDFSKTLEEALKERDQRHDKEQQAAHGSDSANFKLPGEERNRLTRLLYQEFFTQAEGVRATDSSNMAKKAEIEGMYEARIELNWIIEWARDRNFPTQDKFIRAVQGAVQERVEQHKPLSFILGTQPFLGCEIKVEAPLLIPRTETEEWVQWWSTKYMNNTCPDAPLRILDLCCGTGCIGAAVLRQFPNVEVVGVDIEPLAVRTTIDNYRRACEDAIRARMRKRTSDFKEQTEINEKNFKSRINNLVLTMRSEDKTEGQIKKMKHEETQLFIKKEEALLADKKKQDDEDLAELDEIMARKEQQQQKPSSSSPPGSSAPRYTVIQSDMFRHLPESLLGSFDVILANPPYILPEEYATQLPKSVRDWESEIALVGDGRHTGKNLLYFKELRDEAPKWLSPTPYVPEYKGPRLMFELGLQSRIMQKLFSDGEENKKQWPRVDLHLDRFEEPRWCECFYPEAKK